MSRTIDCMTGVLLVCAGLAMAYGQGNGQGGPPATPPGQGPGQGTGPGQQEPPSVQPPTANPAKVIVEYDGTIGEVLAAAGSQYPAIEFTPAGGLMIEVLLAPMWFLTEEVRLPLDSLTGETAHLVALQKTTADVVVYHAISLTVDGETYTFRTDDGKPLWNGSGKKPKDRTAAMPELAPGSTRELGGEVERMVESLTTGEMKMMMLGDDGFRYRICLGPVEDLLAAGVMPREKNRVRVRFALEAETHGAVALQLTTEAQTTVRLRDDNGLRLGPMWE